MNLDKKTRAATLRFVILEELGTRRSWRVPTRTCCGRLRGVALMYTPRHFAMPPELQARILAAPGWGI